MQHVCRRVDSPSDIAALFSEPELSRALDEASGTLVQVFWRRAAPGALKAVCAEIQRRAPAALMVGASSAGQIADGALVPEGIVVLVSCFSSSSLRLFSLEAELGQEAAAGRSLAESLASCSDLQAALLLAMPSEIDTAELLRGFREAGPSLSIFGGAAESGTEEEESGVLCGLAVSARSVAAVALCGPELHIASFTLFDWLPLGPELMLTEVEGNIIRQIDGRPAFDHFKENLGIGDRDIESILEFPLLFERDGALLARNLRFTDAVDCGVTAGDIHTGERARLGYLDMRARALSIERGLESLRAFGPESIFLYSCVCRLSTLQEGIESETRPFQGIAPTGGFFTAGEFFRSGDKARLLNSTELVVALREGPSSPSAGGAVPAQSPSNDSSKERHTRLTSYLFRFIGALTEKVEAANAELSARNRELAASNQMLRAEVTERELAEERAQSIAAEKEILLRELQHRVKNSMALISSIANIEAAQSQAPEAAKALEKLEYRITSLASLYDILYMTGDIEAIQLADYLGRVVEYAAGGLGADAKGIAVRCEAEDVRIDVKRAIPMGLIVNELVTDAIKYAFPRGEGGGIEVSLRRAGGELVLRVEDNGVGMPKDFGSICPSGFGLTLVRSLASQLDARFSIRSEGGARFELRMPVEPPEGLSK